MWNVASLNECISFATSGHGVPVKVDEFKFAKWLENLLDIGFGEVEV